MRKSFFDYNDCDFVYPVSESMAIDSDGNFLLRMDDYTAMDMRSGKLHFISGWSKDEEDYDDDDYYD